ncbi:MAG: hypothetical protein ABIW76_21275 [Fibrobacteria bacterium]
MLGATPGFSTGQPEFQSGVQMGYTYGQNGAGFPSFGKDPLGNPGRAGFYLAQLRLKAKVAFDSTFSAVAVSNIYNADVQEAYLEKRVRNYTFRAGKIRGAGLKSGSGTDEFERIAVNAPRYARFWAAYKRILGLRDFGIQAQGDHFGGKLSQRLFFHNANWQNVINDEPSFFSGNPAQAAGIDYSVDWRISEFTAWGASVGGLADHQWSEFIGDEEGWKVGNWLRSNPIVDASLNHQMDVGRFHLFDEGMLLYNRQIINPVDSGSSKMWGVSSLVRFDLTPRTVPFFRYEFFDPTDGAGGLDNLNMFTLGVIFRPNPVAYPGLKLTTQYLRSLEDGAVNSIPNDLLISQLEMVF